jgi:tRNA wybutosine-synthesizing protein 4
MAQINSTPSAASKSNPSYSNPNLLDVNTTAVVHTSDDAAVSKFSASSLGYFTDNYLQFFINKPNRRPPLINRGYYTRVAAIYSILNEFLSLPIDNKQIISLGAGTIN